VIFGDGGTFHFPHGLKITFTYQWGGNRCRNYRNYFNFLVTFVISGIWHGANWTFIIWGTLNGILHIFEKILKYIRNMLNISFNLCKLSKIVNIICIFILMTMTWVFFRANTISDAFLTFDKILFYQGKLFTNNIDSIIYGLVFIMVLGVADILQEYNNGKHILLENKYKFVRYISYITILIVILLFGVFDSSQFIYFQF
jgi:hypothetical protein